MAGKLKLILDALLMSYARIFFSDRRHLGLIVLCATLIVPAVGVPALVCGALSSMCALLLGMDRDSVSKGVYGLNGVLVGAGIGFYFVPSAAMAAVLVLAALMVTILTILVNTLLYQQSALPAMSIPFTLMTWLILASSGAVRSLIRHHDRIHLLPMPEGLLPYSFEAFFSALGAVLFLPDPLVGLVVAIGLMLWSRIALLLLFTGFATGSVLIQQLGIDSTVVGGNTLLFNHMLAALAIGGIFSMPGPGSLLFAVGAAATSLLLLVGTSAMLPHGISALALPFNVSVMLMLYALRARLHPSFGLQLAPVPPGSPEENLSRSRENMRVWRRWGVPLSMPYRGKWRVSQGVGGAETHKGDWRFAYDFQAVAADGSIYANSGQVCEDYHSWGAPIYSPAPGTVHTVIDGVPDNTIGAINAANNWGNCVIITHADNYYSCLAHLQNGSICVVPGQVVARGEQIGRCGNSGRSPFPHLHFQMQMTPWVGAPGIQFMFENFFLSRQGHESFVSKVDLLKGDVLSHAEPAQEFFRYFPSPVGASWSFRWNRGNEEQREMWEAGVDFYGNTYLVSYPWQTRLYFIFQDGVLTFKKLEGRRDTGLFFLGSMIVDLPFLVVDGAVQWTTVESADYVLWPVLVGLLDLFALAGISLRQKITGTIVRNDDDMYVQTFSRLMLDTPLGSVSMTPPSKAELLFRRDKGVIIAASKAKKLQQI